MEHPSQGTSSSCSSVPDGSHLDDHLHVCDRCMNLLATAKIIIDNVAKFYNARVGKFVAGETSESLSRTRCRICRILGSLPSFREEESIRMSKFDNSQHAIDVHQAIQYAGGNRDAEDYEVTVYVVHTGDRMRISAESPLPVVLHRKGLGESHARTMPSSKDQVPISLPQGMILNPGVLIYDRIKEWLNTCRTDPQHERVCSLKISYRPPNLRLIDVERIVVIPAPPEAEYVALSYVWGANQSEGFPQVVLDSIEVVRALGYRYLWVDKYCIDQNDATNKHEQIRNMHLIYGCADLTIIAAAGTDSAYGLPGVSRHRLPHDTLHFGNITLFLPLLNASRLIKQSYWNSRAWTYQEALLSRRRLVFTDHHVLWQCNNEVFAEGIHWASRHRTHKHHHPFDLSASNAVMSTREGYSLQFSVGSVFDQIEGYSTKRLSYESDRLNAYLGILGDQETRDKPIYHVWGALVIRQGLAWKLKGLDWYRKSPTTRSPIFPSWSWAAWSADGGIHFAGKLGDNGSSTPLDVRTTVWPPDIPAWLPRDKTGRDLDDLISIQTFADRHDEYRSYSTGAHMIRLEVELGEVSLHSVNGKRYVRIQEPDEELLVPFYLDDADFSLEQRQPAHAFKVTHISQWGNDTWVFLVIKMVTDESYQRIGSFRLRLGKIRDEEAIDNFGNSIREENYCNVSEDWRKGLKKTHIWLS